ncbi:MAG: hypothetical protein GF421_02265 [Candidatus Aminicenantes bacterium]|nr:hypothetical protein [Candidatus Aminicenantes bacterium]
MKLRKQITRLFVILVIFANMTLFLMSQHSTTCSISGVVKDTDNNPLSKATVILEGAPMLGLVVYVTKENGSFHFANLPPGQGYSLHAEKPEFQTKKFTGIHIAIGQDINIPVVLSRDPQMSFEVIQDQSPALDAKQTETTVRYSQELIQSLPLHRDLFEVLNSIPGSVPENPRIRRAASVSGGSVRQNRFVLDGVVLNDPLDSYPATNVNVDTYGEIEFGVAGHNAETTGADGGYINIVSKSGGNQFKGSLLTEYYDKAMQSTLLSPEDLNLLGLKKPTEFNSWNDLSFSVGGPVAKDVLSLFVNARYTNRVQNFYHADWSSTLDAGKQVFVLDLAPHREYNVFGKITSFLPLDIRASITYNLTAIKEEFNIDRIQKNLDQTATNKREGELAHLLSIQASYALTPDLFLNGRVTYLFRKFSLPYSDLSLAEEPRNYDRYFNMYRNNPEFQQKSVTQKLNPAVKATYFNDNFLGVKNMFKFGLEYEWNLWRWDFWRENPYYFDYYRGDLYSYPTEMQPNRGRIYAYSIGSFEGSSILENETHRIGGFVKESLTIADRLTLNLGARIDYSNSRFPVHYRVQSADPYGLFDVLPGVDLQYGAYNPGSRDVMKWFDISPRLGLVLDVFGDGETILSGTYSQYHESIAFRYFNRVSPIYPQLSSWYWIDEDLDQEPDADDTYTQIDLAENPDEVDISTRLDPDAKSPITDEFTVGLEQEINTNLTVGATFVYKHKKNIFGNVNDYGLGAEEAWKGYSTDSPYWETFEFTDPGEDGVFGTGDDQSSYCYVELIESPGGRNWYYTNIESAFRKYTALELVLNKRMSNKWQLLASLVWSKAWGNIGSWDMTTSASSVYFNTPNSLVYADGRLDFDRPLNVKIQGSVQLPYGFDLGCYYNYRSGIPWNRMVTVCVPEDDRYLDPGACYTVATEKRGTRRTPALSTLDLRLQKNFWLSDALSVDAYLDVLNVLGGTSYFISTHPGGFIDYRDPDNPTFERYGDYVDFGGFDNRLFKVGLRIHF